jgi:tetrapyrrole methylase family protein/MazG family protein
LARIHVVGLGPGGLDRLPVAVYRLLTGGLPVILRTAVHPVVADLKQQGLRFETFDHLYERGERFEDIYREMAEQLVQRARREGELVYAVPGHPLMAEQSVQLLRQLAPEAGVEVLIGPGQSFLDDVCTAVGLDPIDGMLLLDGTALRAEQLQPGLHAVIAQVFQPQVASDVKLTLMEVYPDDHPVWVVRAAGVPGEERVQQVPLYELDRVDGIDHLTTVVVPALPPGLARRRDLWFAVDVVRRLRAPDGCPWDRQQTHQSLRRYVIEEAYEVAHAIDEDDPDHLAEELGDLLLQVLLHAQIASERGDFDVRDVFGGLAEKLVRRHPHVFGGVEAGSPAEAQARWNDIKQKERQARAAGDGAGTEESVLDEVRWGRPAWMVAADLQERAAKVGFDWANVRDVMDKVEEEVRELAGEVRQAARTPGLSGGDTDRGAGPAASPKLVEEFGDMLFAIANLARWLQLDVEEVLSKANRKFVRRFQWVERRVKESGRPWAAFSLEELDTYWNEAKMHAERLDEQEFAGRGRNT